jgi:hypothetical protein
MLTRVVMMLVVVVGAVMNRGIDLFAFAPGPGPCNGSACGVRPVKNRSRRIAQRSCQWAAMLRIS